jgi:mRNA interferase HigB
LSRRRLREFWERQSRAEISLRAWYKVARLAMWRDFSDLRRSFPSADQVGRLVVFNIAGNRYRLVAKVDFRRQKVFIRKVMTHEEYDGDEWKRDPWF